MGKKAPTLTKPMTKTELVTQLADASGVARRDVTRILDALAGAVDRHLKKGSVGTFVLPGLLKITAVKKPARKAQKGVPNPFKPGETMDVAAKPASVKVKVRALKNLKDMV